MKVLGISAFFHDAAAALVVDGQVVAAVEEERLSRKKHDASLPVLSITEILEDQGITSDDLDAVVFYEKPLKKFDRILQGQLAAFPRGFKRFARAMPTWLSRRLWMEHELASRIDVDPDKVLFSSHHLSHAASAFYPSPFESAAVLTVDGVGEWASSGVFHGTGATLRPVVEQRYPHSLGLLYSALTAYLGFEVNEGEYKVMGLAGYGTPRFREAFDRLVQVADDGALTLDLRYFAFQRSATQSFSPRMEALLGPARKPGAPLDPMTPDAEMSRFADIAATLQAVTEDTLLLMARHALVVTGERNLCLAGGVALNSVANARLSRELDVDGIYVHPAAGDSGGAVGAALWASHEVFGVPRHPVVMPRANYLGRSVDDASIGRFLADCRIPARRFEDDAALDAEVATRLARGEVGAYVQGGFEWGPRALGARSILADPRRADMTRFVNEKVKFREPFRPFAPACLAREASRFFELDPRGRDRFLTPYMLAVVPVTEEGRRVLPATTHVDGTARVQVVDAAHSPRFARLIEAFAAQTGVGCLLNTSLNLKGEPLCATPADAYSTYSRSGLDFLAMGNFVVSTSLGNRDDMEVMS